MIVGFNFKKINVERKKKLIKGMKVVYNMDISNVYNQDFLLNKSKSHKILGFDFSFTVRYEPEIADMTIGGTVNYMLPENETKRILDLWKKSRKLPKEVSVPVINVILDRCNIKALELEQDLSLPTHLPMPSIGAGKVENKDAEKYIG
ncbi:MAG: hypothetical protein Q8Q42_00370 [Nanoarchaeota archaeon]|nr:hypothetical protein [Nanoarchaeota archaeon]